MRELFVWYRVADAGAQDALVAVHAMQRGLRADFDGLEARVLVRADATVKAQTWMEAYARPGHDGGVDGALEAAIEARAAAIAALVEGPRHVEAFAPPP